MVYYRQAAVGDPVSVNISKKVSGVREHSDKDVWGAGALRQGCLGCGSMPDGGRIVILYGSTFVTGPTPDSELFSSSSFVWYPAASVRVTLTPPTICWWGGMCSSPGLAAPTCKHVGRKDWPVACGRFEDLYFQGK